MVMLVAWFGLAWFVTGLGIGSRLNAGAPKGGRAAPAARNDRRRRDDDNAESGDDNELYVGNLSYDIGDKELTKIFEAYGKVSSVRIITHRMSGKSKGFGFVSMPNPTEMRAAVAGLHNKEVKGRRLVVNEAKSRARDDQ